MFTSPLRLNAYSNESLPIGCKIYVFNRVGALEAVKISIFIQYPRVPILEFNGIPRTRDKRPALLDVVARAIDEAFPALHFVDSAIDSRFVCHVAPLTVHPVDGVILGRRGLNVHKRLLDDVAARDIIASARRRHKPT